jgi:hypothetical protein
MHIWTETPLDAIWQQLRYFKSVANGVRLLTCQSKSGRDTPWKERDAERAASEISACVSQADEYFHASQVVGLATKPLLQFYGAHSLAKAVVLANDPNVCLSDLRYHGLNSRSSTAQESERTHLQSYVDNSVAWTLEEEFAVTHEGVFRYLTKVAGEQPLNQGHVFRFKDLLRVIPDLSDLYRRHYGEASHCLDLYSGPELAEDGVFTVYFNETRDEVLKVFPEFTSGFEEVWMHEDFPGYRATKPLNENPHFAAEECGAVAGRYYVRPTTAGIHSPMATLFISMFILGNVVRYKPSFWMGIINGNNSGSGFMAEALCNLFERHFPNQVLEHIWHERFTYGTPGYLSS